MKILLKILLFVNILQLFNNDVYSQWQLLKEFEGYYISERSGISFENYVCFGTSRGILISSDLGETWQIKKNKFTKDTIKSLAKFDRKIFAAYWREGLYVSEDTMNTWIEKNKGLNISGIIWTIASKDNNLFLGTYDDGIFRSTDGG